MAISHYRLTAGQLAASRCSQLDAAITPYAATRLKSFASQPPAADAPRRRTAPPALYDEAAAAGRRHIFARRHGQPDIYAAPAAYAASAATMLIRR